MTAIGWVSVDPRGTLIGRERLEEVLIQVSRRQRGGALAVRLQSDSPHRECGFIALPEPGSRRATLPRSDIDQHLLSGRRCGGRNRKGATGREARRTGEDAQVVLRSFPEAGGWYGRAASGGNFALDRQIARNRYYDAGCRGPLVERQPAPGETIGLFSVAGNARSITLNDSAQSTVCERSNVVPPPMPGVDGAMHRF